MNSTALSLGKQNNTKDLKESDCRGAEEQYQESSHKKMEMTYSRYKIKCDCILFCYFAAMWTLELLLLRPSVAGRHMQFTGFSPAGIRGLGLNEHLRHEAAQLIVIGAIPIVAAKGSIMPVIRSTSVSADLE